MNLTVLSFLLSLIQADEDRDSGTESDEEIDDPDLPSGKSIFIFSFTFTLHLPETFKQTIFTPDTGEFSYSSFGEIAGTPDCSK